MSMVKNWQIKDANGNMITIAAKSPSSAKHQFRRMLAGAEIVEIKCLGDIPRKTKIKLPQGDDAEFKAVEPVRGDKFSLGRNDSCGCGSGRKYKKCCMRKAIKASSSAM